MKKITRLTTVLISFSILFLTIFQSNVYAATASIGLSGGGNVTTNQNISVVVSVNGSDAYNAVSVTVNFTNLSYSSVTASSNWTGVVGPSVSGNTISFSGAKLGGSYTGSKNVLTVNFKAPSSVGNSSITASGTIALADGSGTQVNAGSKTISYKVNTPPPPDPTVPGKVTVTSTTYLDPNLWYSDNSTTLNWTASGATGYSFSLDQSDQTVPDNETEGMVSTKTYSALPDGVSYFHVKAQNAVGWSNPTHFKIQVDSVKPYPFTITKVQDEKTLDYTIYFSTFDELSGVSKYVLSIDGVDLGEQRSKYTLPTSAKVVEVNAYDSAGNITKSILQISNTSSLSSNSNTNNNSSVETIISANGPLILGLLIGVILFGLAGVIIVKFSRKSRLENQESKDNDKLNSSKKE